MTAFRSLIQAATVAWLAIFSLVTADAAGAAKFACPPALDFEVRPLTGDKPVHLCEAFRGKVVLVVNTAGKRAFTPQYEGLEDLYGRYRDRGLVVAGFPSNDSRSIDDIERD